MRLAYLPIKRRFNGYLVNEGRESIVVISVDQ